MTTLRTLALGRLLLPLAAGLAIVLGTRAWGSEVEVRVKMIDTRNEPAGEATLRQTPNGVLLQATLRGLPPGRHGFHIHETGRCEPPFESAGGHFNPTKAAHGFGAAAGPHAGDLPNLDVPESGVAMVEAFVSGVTLETGKPGSLVDGDGTALMVHAGPDDYVSDPAGKAGNRIACGVIARSAGAR